MSQMPRVSVIIPAFNAGSFIERTLESLKNQTFASFEAIIVDDGSTDDTSEIICRMVEQDSRFRYLRLQENSNRPSVPRNMGIEAARGEYLAFLDADDLWTRRKLERQVMVLASRSDLALVHSHLWDFTERSWIIGLFFIPNPYRRRSNYQILCKRNVVQCSSVLARTSIVRDLGGFDERPGLRAVEDYHLWLRVAASGHRLGYISEIHGFYRVRRQSTSALEDMEARLTFLDSIEGTQSRISSDTLKRRLLRKVVTFPFALYHHILEGFFRQSIRKQPRVFFL